MSGVPASVPASLHGRSNSIQPSGRVSLAKSAAVVGIIALIPLVGWLTWQGLGGIRTTPAAPSFTAEQANARLEQVPAGAGMPGGSANATAAATPSAATLPASEVAAPILTAGTTSQITARQTPAASPSESASQAQGPKGAILIKGLGFLTIDPPAADKPEPTRARDEGGNSIKPKPVMRVSERPAAVPKGVDPCQDINRKLSTQDPTPEDIAFLKRGCR
jgi:hypothetical protein